MAIVFDDYGNPLDLSAELPANPPPPPPPSPSASGPDYGGDLIGPGGAGTSYTGTDYPGGTDTFGGSSSSASGGLSKLLDSLLGAGGKMLDYATNNPLQSALMATLLYKALQGSSSNQPAPAGYKGSINMGLKAARAPSSMPAFNLYSGQPVYGPSGGGVTYAAQGGLMGMAHGRYLRGSTDGMADKLDTSIDGKQPAKLSHGEFVVPADVVSHLGNGNSDAGAQKLYQMMDRVRMARTGTKQQGKQINPNKFMPGGSVGEAKYAGGGPVAFADGGTTTSTSNLAEWAGPYVTDYLSKASALSNLPYQSFTDYYGGNVPLTAGESPLQSLAYQGLAGLGAPSQFGTATNFLTRAGQQAAGFGYQPQNVYAPSLQQYQMQQPQNVQGAQTSAAQLSAAPQAQAAQSTYAPNIQAYQMGPAERVGTQGFDTAAAQGLMSPYMQNVVDVQQQQAQRQADIANQATKAQFAQAGAYGGGRFGVQQAQAAADLARQKQGIQAQGLQSAYQQAQQQFNTQQQAAMQAALANQQAGLTTGIQNLGAQQAAQQLGVQTGMQTALQNAQLQQQANLANQGLLGQYGLQQGQFGQAANLQNAQLAQQAMLANQQMGYNTGLQNLQALLSTQQLGAGQNLQAQLANQQAAQAGAGLGLQANQQLLGAGQALGGLGQTQYGTQLQGLQALLGAGGTQQQTAQAGIDALMNQYKQQQMWPYQQLQFQQSMLQGLPVSAYTATQPGASTLQNLIGVGAGLGGLSQMFPNFFKSTP